MTKVLIVDDSPLLRSLLERLLRRDSDIQDVTQVESGEAALDFLATHTVDVVTMDIQMPGMDGFEATRRIMETAPVPIVIVSACWEPEEIAKTFQAMEAGAVAILGKPKGAALLGDSYAAELVTAVKQAAAARVRRLRPRPAARPAALARKEGKDLRLVALGASTGGPQAIQQFLAALPVTFPLPILVVQHISPGFTQGFVEWLNRVSSLPVVLAADGEEVRGGRVYVAPEGKQMEVRSGGKVALFDGPKEHSVRPSVSCLFRAVARVYGPNAAGVLLTGMGKDGAAELKEIRDAGGVTFAQDEESSAVWGMPGNAVRLGAVMHVLPIPGIASMLSDLSLKRTAPEGA